MRYLISVGAAVAGLALALPASAQVTGARISSSGNFLTLNSNGLFNGTTPVAALAGGTVYTSDKPFADIPAGNIFGSTFLAAGPSSGPLAMLTFANPVSYLSFLWGSPDTYNMLNVNYGGATSGMQTFTASGLGFTSTSGNQNVSQYVAFTAAPGTFINSVSFSNSPQMDAFETANFSIAAPVPEPASWALMLVGVGFMGFALRRQKAATRVAYA